MSEIVEPEKPAAEGPETEQPAAETPPPRRSLLLRLLRGALFGVLGIVLLVLGVLAWVVGTESGLRFVRDLAHRFAPELITIQGVEGRLIDRARLTGTRLDTPAASVVVGELLLHWVPADLLSGRLTIAELKLGGLEIGITEPAEPPPEEPDSGPIELPNLVLPIALEIRRAAVEGLKVTDAGQKTLFQMDRLELAAGWQGQEAEIRKLEVSLPEPQLSAGLKAKVDTAGAYPLQAALEWKLVPIGEAVLEGQGRLSGDISALNLEHRLSGAAEAELTAEVRDALGQPSWRGELKLAKVDLPAFVADLPRAAITAHLTTEGNLEKAHLAGQIGSELPDQPEYGKLKARLDVDWADSILTLKDLRLEEGKSKGHLSASGRADLHAGLGPFDLSAQWAHLSWPLQGEPLVTSEGGEASVSGDLERFLYKLDGRVRGAQVPATRVRAEGTGNLEGTEIAELRVDTLEGHLKAKGKVGWAPALSWNAALDAADINPGSQWQEWKGRLGGRVTSEGSLKDGGLRLETLIEALGGELRGYPVEVKGRVAMQGKEVQIERLALQSGPSRAEVEGHVGDKLGLRFSLDSPDLGTLLPELKGALSVEGSAEGRRTAPEVSLKLKAKEVAFGEHRVARADALVDLGLSTDQRLRIDFDASGIAAGGLQWDKATVKGDGKLGAHQVVADLQGKPLAIRVEVSGGLAGDKGYSGNLTALQLVTPDYGDWRLGQPAPFSAAGAKVQVGPLCLRETKGGSNGCASFQQPSAGQWRAKLDWPSLALTLAEPLLPEGAEIDGSLSAKVDMEAVNGTLKGTLQVQVPKGDVKLAFGEAVNHLDFSGGELRATANASGVKADVNLPLLGLGGLEGSLALDGWRLEAPARPSQPLRGRLQARIDDLGPLAAMAPDVSKLKGRIDADLKLQGTLQQPGIEGYAKLAGGEADIPLAGLELRGINLTARSQGSSRLEYDGGLTSGSGTLKVSGQSQLTGKQGWRTEIGIKGDRLTAANTSEYFALVSPDLKLEIAERLIRLGGEVSVPEARIMPRSVPEGTVTPSRDVILLRDLEAASKPGTKIAADVRVRLGNDVNIEGFGLRGKLRGDLRVVEEPGKRPFGDGQLAVVDGLYRLTGIKGLASAGELQIEQGRVIFAKTPLDDPGLLLIANRQVGKVTASLRVSGTLRKPKMTFFSDSDPAMSQSEVLNYLLTGGASLGSGGGSASQVVEVGTYVSPKLYMQYENNLGDKTNKVKMRYDLTDSIQVQTESGAAQGVDFFYTFER